MYVLLSTYYCLAKFYMVSLLNHPYAGIKIPSLSLQEITSLPQNLVDVFMMFYDDIYIAKMVIVMIKYFIKPDLVLFCSKVLLLFQILPL